jgi:hypothetical protein
MLHTPIEESGLPSRRNSTLVLRGIIIVFLFKAIRHIQILERN